MSAAMAAYAALVERGCQCGTDRPADCPIHGASDLRGLAAFMRAGCPQGFPITARCAVCRTEGLMYPSVALDRGEVPAGQAPPPTVVCPRCSPPASEVALVRECVAAGYDLNDRRVFGC